MLLNGSELKFTPERMKEKLDEYFEITPVEKITITGVCLHLGIVKDTFYNYAKRDGFKHMIKMARMRVENAYELSLRDHGRAGDIFALKNFGWTDRQDINYTKKPTPTVIVDDSEED